MAINRKINKCKLPIICSLGGANENDIEKLVFLVINKKIKFLYCVAKYPTSINELNLDTFRILKENMVVVLKDFLPMRIQVVYSRSFGFCDGVKNF